MSTYQQYPNLSAIDIILSCTICQATLSSIYAEDDHNQGLRKGVGPHDSRMTKLWLTECAHLSCARHFEGGGVPFHPEQQTPHAPCPLCVFEKNDRSEKALFYINGTAKGEYDSKIPESYFQTPPVIGGGTDPAFDALLFQYLSLIRFGVKINDRALRSADVCRRWEERKPEIVRSLSNVAPLRGKLLSAGRRLIALGQDVSSIEAVLNTAGTSLIQDRHLQHHSDDQQQLLGNSLLGYNVSRSHTTQNFGFRLAQGSIADLDRLTQNNSNVATSGLTSQPYLAVEHTASDERKRPRPVSGIMEQFQDTRRSPSYAKCNSRELMPPPPIPIRAPSVFTSRIADEELENLTNLPNGNANQAQNSQAPTSAGSNIHGAGGSWLSSFGFHPDTSEGLSRPPTRSGRMASDGGFWRRGSARGSSVGSVEQSPPAFSTAHRPGVAFSLRCEREDNPPRGTTPQRMAPPPHPHHVVHADRNPSGFRGGVSPYGSEASTDMEEASIPLSRGTQGVNGDLEFEGGRRQRNQDQSAVPTDYRERGRTHGLADLAIVGPGGRPIPDPRGIGFFQSRSLSSGAVTETSVQEHPLGFSSAPRGPWHALTSQNSNPTRQSPSPSPSRNGHLTLGPGLSRNARSSHGGASRGPSPAYRRAAHR